ncbi:MAG: hypothetical protein M3R38_07735 [Actinomycetota bacterium]|nr:hypothetical protein [Actinomycetota bacterium]MDP9475568.1 hypothetical protein [Actinomycetota bacterium]
MGGPCERLRALERTDQINRPGQGFARWKAPVDFDADLCRERNAAERDSGRLGQRRGLVSRYYEYVFTYLALPEGRNPKAKGLR